jgi:arylamine N-acetyltransferase
VGDTRVNLLNASVTVRGADGNAEQRTLSDPGKLNEVLTETMGLQLPVPVEEIWEKLPAEMVPQWP